MKRFVAILTVLVLQGSLFAATQTQAPKKACCKVNHCISETVSCCKKSPSQPTQTPVATSTVQGLKDFCPVVAVEIPTPRTLSTSTYRALLSSAPTRGSPLYQLKSAFLI